ncbi:MAG: hypothetical protein ACLFSQ_08820 [Candidatus Zixiibacteriota bacterium]
MRKILLILLTISLIYGWTHALSVRLRYPDGIPSGESNLPEKDGNDDRNQNGGFCNWKHNGMWFAVWVSKPEPNYHVSDTFFPGDVDWGHGYYDEMGYYVSSLDVFKTVGRRSQMRVQANDTLHMRFRFEKGNEIFIWGLDTVFTEAPGEGTGSVYINANMVPIEKYYGPVFEGCD